MNDKIEWLDEFHKSLDSLHADGCDLRRISRAFAITGNSEMAETLSAIGESVLAAAQSAGRAVSADISARCASSQRQFHETAGLVLCHLLSEGKAA